MQNRFDWRTLVVCGVTMIACLAGGAGYADGDKGATDQNAALAMIRQADAVATAETIEALQRDLTPLEREWGIKVLGVRWTTGGYMLDFRYQVLDPDKAIALLHRAYSTRPHVEVDKSGAVLTVPFTQKAGALRSSVSSPEQIKIGRNYTALFANPGQHVSPGDTVTVVIGDFRLEKVTVQ